MNFILYYTSNFVCLHLLTISNLMINIIMKTDSFDKDFADFIITITIIKNLNCCMIDLLEY